MVSAHGSDVAIASVNRVRSGGVAGFFCREEYEIILAEETGTESGVGSTSDGASNPSRGGMVDLRVGDDDGFREVLEEHLLHTEESERVRGDERRPADHAPIPAPRTGDDIETETETETEVTAAAASAPTPPRSSSFWMRLYRLRRELDARLPPTNDITAVVGPLVQTMPVIRHLQCEAGLPAEDVIVLTPRAEVISEPSWSLINSGQHMLEAMAGRRGKPAVVAIDVDIELPVWVEPLLMKLRQYGLGVTRYLLADLDQLEILLHHRGAGSGAFMIDISRPLPPAELVELIDRHLPIATVAGVNINAELLLAMRGQLGDG